MSELESGRLEVLTDLARLGRIPSALRLQQEDRIRCILKADELIRKAKMLLTGEGVGGKTALDYIQTSESAMRAQAIHALRHQILGGRIALEHLNRRCVHKPSMHFATKFWVAALRSNISQGIQARARRVISYRRPTLMKFPSAYPRLPAAG